MKLNEENVKSRNEKSSFLIRILVVILLSSFYCFKIIEILKIGKDTSIQGVPEKIYGCEKGSLNINGHFFLGQPVFLHIAKIEVLDKNFLKRKD